MIEICHASFSLLQGFSSINVDLLIKSMEDIRPLNSSFSLENINGQNVSMDLINVPSSNLVHPSYLDLDCGSISLAVPLDNSYPYLACTNCNHVHGGEVSQLRDADSKSLMPNICHFQPLTSEEEGHASRPNQAGSLIDPFLAILFFPEIYSLMPLVIFLLIQLLILRSPQNLMTHLSNVQGLIRNLRHFSFN